MKKVNFNHQENKSTEGVKQTNKMKKFYFRFNINTNFQEGNLNPNVNINYEVGDNYRGGIALR